LRTVKRACQFNRYGSGIMPSMYRPPLPRLGRAMALARPGEATLHAIEREVVPPGAGELLLRVHVGGVCRTDSDQQAAPRKERCVYSVAHLTGPDGETLFAWATTHPIASKVETFPLAESNEALARLRSGRLAGASVLDCR